MSIDHQDNFHWPDTTKPRLTDVSAEAMLPLGTENPLEQIQPCSCSALLRNHHAVMGGVVVA